MRKLAGKVDELPWPAGWSTPRATASRVLSIELLGFFLLIALWFAVLTTEAEKRGGPVIVLGVGVLCAGTLTIIDLRILRARHRCSLKAISLHRTGSARDGVAMFYTSRAYRLFRPLLLLTSVIVAGYAVGVAMGWASPGSAPSADVTAITGGAALSLSLAWVGWLGWAIVQLIDRRVVKGCLVLCPDGIYHRSYTFEHFVPWHCVVDVSADELRGPVIVAKVLSAEGISVRRTSRMGRQWEFKLLPFVVVPGRYLAVDPGLAYHAVRYYESHPGARAELATRAGEDRVRGGNLLG